jgi:hypothetical protein
MVHVSRLSFDDFIRGFEQNISDIADIRNEISSSHPIIDSAPVAIPVETAQFVEEFQVQNPQHSPFMNALGRKRAASACVNDRKVSPVEPQPIHSVSKRYLLVDCPLCKIPMPFCLPRPILVNRSLYAILAHEKAENAFNIVQILYETDESAAVPGDIAKALQLYHAGDYTNTLEILRQSKTQDYLLQMFRSVCYMRLGDDIKSHEVENSALKTVPIKNACIGMMVHWNRYILNGQRGSLKEVVRCRDMAYGGIKRMNEGSCKLCAL